MYYDQLSFVLNTDLPSGIEPGSMFDKLLQGITARVKVDGIKKDAILFGDNAASMIINASENIYYDVAEFYNWYFDPNDERNEFLMDQKKATILSPLRALVKPVIEQGLLDLREAELIPEGMDSPNLLDTVTDNLTRYILNWQDWYYDRKEEEDLEDYMVDRQIYQDIYIDSDYGDFTNITNYLDDDISD